MVARDNCFVLRTTALFAKCLPSVDFPWKPRVCGSSKAPSLRADACPGQEGSGHPCTCTKSFAFFHDFHLRRKTNLHISLVHTLLCHTLCFIHRNCRVRCYVSTRSRKQFSGENQQHYSLHIVYTISLLDGYATYLNPLRNQGAE